MANKFSEAEKRAKRELKLVISVFIALKHIHQLIEKAEGDVGKSSDKEARLEIKHIWRKLRTGIFGSAERSERKVARNYKELLERVKETEVNLSPEEVAKINSTMSKSNVFNSLLERYASRGGDIEKALKEAMEQPRDIQKLETAKKLIEETIRDTQGFDAEMKILLEELNKDELISNVVAVNLKTALEKKEKDLSALMVAFKPVFATTNVADRKRMIANIKSGLKLKEITVLGVGGNALVLKINLYGKDYALKISTEKLANEIINLTKAKGIMGIPKFYFETSVQGLQAILVEYIAGPTLKDYVKEYSLPNDFFERIEIIVKQLHARGVAHKDIQDANIMVVGGYPYFLDFSLASPKATPAQERFDFIFVDTLKLQYMKYINKYRNNPIALNAAMKEILNSLVERLRTETNRENIETIQITLSQAKKLGLLI